jgi:hypothetical protein
MPFIKTGSLRVKAFSERGDLTLSSFRDRKASAGQEVAAIDPNFLYVWVTGLHGDAPNQNGDYFPWTELIRPHHQVIGKAVYATWIGCPNLCDHDHKRIVGMIIDAGPVPDQKAIDMVVKIDKRVHADLCKRIKAGQQTALSMGCLVQKSFCSLCGNEAHNEAEWCFPAGTSILSSELSTVPIESVKIGDRVVTHTGSVRNVTKLFSRYVQESLRSISFWGSNTPLVLTKNHPLFVFRAKDAICRCDKRQVCFSPGDFFICGFRKCSGNGAAKVPKFVPAGDVHVGDYLLTPVLSGGPTRVFTETEAKILGWYMAEGCIGNKHYLPGSQRVDFCFSTSEKALIDEVKRCVTALTGKVVHQYRAGPNAVALCVYDGALADFCRLHCGEYSREKRMSRDLLLQPTPILRAFLLAYWQGDGYLFKGRSRCAQQLSVETASDALAAQLPLAFDRLGMHASICRYKNSAPPHVRNGRSGKFSGLSDLWINRIILSSNPAEDFLRETDNKSARSRYFTYGGTVYRVHKVTTVSEQVFAGVVYNMEVEGDNSYIAKGVAVHNCECLSPQRLNLKGKVDHRTGKYVYEDNRDVTGEEVSWITFGEAADPKATTREVLAASQAKKETNVDEAKIARGIAPRPFEESRFLRSSTAGSVTPPSGGGGGGELGPRAMAQLRQAIREERGLALPVDASPAEVLRAIARGALEKSDAIKYAIRLGFFKPEQAEDISVKQAVEALQKAGGAVRAQVSAQIEAEVPGAPDPVDDMAEAQAAGKMDAPFRQAQVIGDIPGVEADLPGAALALLDAPPEGAMPALPPESPKPDAKPEVSKETLKEIKDTVGDAIDVVKDLEKSLKEIKDAASPGKEKAEPKSEKKEHEKKETPEEEKKEEHEKKESPKEEKGEKAPPFEKKEDGEKKEGARTVEARINVDALANALDTGGFYSSGAFNLARDGTAFTYGVLIGKNLGQGKYWVSSTRYSVTSSGHQNALRQAAERVWGSQNVVVSEMPEMAPVPTEDIAKETAVAPMAPVARTAFAVKHVRANGQPGSSSWIVSADGKDIIRVTASRVYQTRQALAENLKAFESELYARSLLRSLTVRGISGTVKALGGHAAVDYLTPAKEVEAMDKLQKRSLCTGIDNSRIVEDSRTRVKAQVEVKVPMGQSADDLRASPDAQKSATEEPKALPPVMNLMRDSMAGYVAFTDGLTAEQVVKAMTDMVLDPQSRGRFAGELQKKIEELQAEKASQGTPADKGAVPPQAEVPPAGETNAPAEAAGGKEKSAMVNQEKVASLLSAARDAVEQSQRRAMEAVDAFKKESSRRQVAETKLAEIHKAAILKARTVRGKELAARLVKVGFINEKDASRTAVELARLDDAKFSEQVGIADQLERQKEVIAERVAERVAEKNAEAAAEEAPLAPKGSVTVPGYLDSVPQQDSVIPPPRNPKASVMQGEKSGFSALPWGAPPAIV